MPFFFRKSSRKVNSEVSAEAARQQRLLREAQLAAAASNVALLMQDPMRMSNVPDVLGGFVDPMGGRASYSVSRDPTCTGA
ncbi:hypothetical protein BJV82DRAFT_626955 [Fennellomyces sp. T-0311]|nr:hypothetical protein BJV82DRAFT_626955 [Fennellomyces sp. T-0311]